MLYVFVHLHGYRLYLWHMLMESQGHQSGQVELGVQLGMGGEGLSTVVRCNTTYKCDLTLWYHCTTGLMQQIEPIGTVVTTYGTTLSVVSNCPFSLPFTRSTAFDATWSSEIHQLGYLSAP